MHEHVLAMQAALGRAAASPEGMLEGVVVAGSWNPAEGTIEVQIGDTAAVFTDMGDSPVTIQATVLTPGLGEQYGPIGGERCLLFRTQAATDDVAQPTLVDLQNVNAELAQLLGSEQLVEKAAPLFQRRFELAAILAA